MRICAPFRGILNYHIHDGESVTQGQHLATVSANGFHMDVTAPDDGVVALLIDPGAHVDSGDIILSLTDATSS